MTRPHDGHASAVRLLIVPGLHGSAPDHWQSRLERTTPGAVRIRLEDWGHADLARWAAAIDEVLRQHRAAAWVAVAHGFGCLALAHHAAGGGRGLHGALLVAPVSPDRYGLDEGPIAHPLPCVSTLVIADRDPWMPRADALYFGRRWGSAIIDLGAAPGDPALHAEGLGAAIGPWVHDHLQRVAATLKPRPRSAAPAVAFAV